jgi:O-antigen/teichoic acid export membrane protein
MSSIRRQSIISSIVIYIGFGVGLANTYLFTRKGVFIETQYGLYNAFIAIALLMMSFSTFGMQTFIHKFFPYYKQLLPDKKNDQAAIALITGIIGFLIIITAGILLKPLVIKKYITNAPEIITYYNWIFVLGFGYMVYNLLEAFTWQLHRSVFANFLRELGWRIYTSVLIILFWCKLIDFSLFIKLFSFSYPFIALVLLIYLTGTRQLHLVFRISKVTRRYKKYIWQLCLFVYAGLIILNLSMVFDTLLIGSVKALALVGVYALAQNIATMIQAPQRAIIAASIAHLSRAWKEKNIPLIQKIYQRSSINQLIFSCGFMALVVLSFNDAVTTFNIKAAYAEAFIPVIFLGLTKVVDMGTGVNTQIIGTSVYWKFDLISGVILLAVMLPTSYFFTIYYGIVGTSVAQLISITLYNLIRFLFLWKKCGLFPFTIHTIQALLLAGVCFVLCLFVFRNMHGWAGMILRSGAFILLYGGGAVYMKLSPDIASVMGSIKKRLGGKTA